MASFSASVSAWVAATKQRQEAVFKESVQRVRNEIDRPVAQGGNMPVDTGFLRASAVGTLGDALPGLTFREAPGGSYVYDGSAVNLVIAGWAPGKTITIAWTANYAKFVNDGTSRMRARHFLELGVQHWPQIVEQVCREAQTRVESRP